ncbi:hypothetical protein [Gordonia sp. KTR9]|uniref:hypothetical protein n=1 Tax=Gordonia sp. KTR9 TaxID=337191 RepID=UPI00027DDB9C|nr:hypothetical protein [Gordonia sp. KTR9]AFR47634.1 hypothetical protein KTR9_0989 [Gordonia sp. KTR9]
MMPKLLRDRSTPASVAAACLLVVGALLSGCGVQKPKDIPALSMSKEDVWVAVSGNMAAVDPDYVTTPMPANTSMRFQQNGCATDPNTLMPSGPPWWYRENQTFRDPSAERVDTVRRGIEKLMSQGFTRKQQSPSRDPRDLTVEDARGFAVGIHHTEFSSGNENVTVTSTSPCVRHPGHDG